MQQQARRCRIAIPCGIPGCRNDTRLRATPFRIGWSEGVFCREGYHCVAVAFDAHITMSLPRRAVAATSDDRTRQLRLELFELGVSLGLAAQACQSIPSRPLGLRPSQPGLPMAQPCYRATLSLAPLLACRCRGGFRWWEFPLRARPLRNRTTDLAAPLYRGTGRCGRV